eukprot:s4600_g6.t1
MPLNSKEQHLGFGFVHLRGLYRADFAPGGSFGWRPQSFQRLLLQGLGESLPTAQSPLTEPNFSANLPQDTVWRRRQDRVAPG